jgi:hypothetical protein
VASVRLAECADDRRHALARRAGRRDRAASHRDAHARELSATVVIDARGPQRSRPITAAGRRSSGRS